jgi:hypothetical protein
VKEMRTLALVSSLLVSLQGCAATGFPGTMAAQSDTPACNMSAMMTPNLDGTITVKKVASNGSLEKSGAGSELVIPAQVITPIVPQPTANPPPPADDR